MGICNNKAQIVQSDFSVPIQEDCKFTVKKYNPFVKDKSCVRATTISDPGCILNQKPASSNINDQAQKRQNNLPLNSNNKSNPIMIPKENLKLAHSHTINVHGEVSNSDSILPIHKSLNQEEAQQFYSFLENYFFFQNFEVNELKSRLKICSIEDQQIFFLEGEEAKCMYIIISGECEMYKNGIEKVVHLDNWTPFGELGVIEECSLRTYSVRALTKMIFFVLEAKDYRILRKKHSIVNKKNELIEICKMINKIPLLTYLDDNEKENLYRLVYDKEIKKGAPDVKLDEMCFIVKTGKVNCYSKDANVNITLSRNHCYGMRYMLLNNEHSTFYLKAIEDSVIYIIPQKAFIELLGIDYQYNLLYPYFRHVMANNDFFSKVLNELQFVPLFQLFKMKTYNADEIVFEKGMTDKIIVILEGELYKKEENLFSVKVNEIFGQRYCLSNTLIDKSIHAKTNTLLLESTWSEMKEKINNLTPGLLDMIDKIKMMDMLKDAPLDKVIAVTSMLDKETFDKGDVIIKNHEQDKESLPKFYMVYSGEAKLRHNNKTIRRYGIGNSFGEVFMLNVQDASDEVIASSDNVEVFSINQKKFINLISEKMFNDYIKKKMCNEDNEIAINELYFLLEYDSKWTLVHNSDEFYSAKHYQKIKENYKKVKNEVYALTHLDSPYIQKKVKAVENDNFCVVLFENIYNATSLLEYASKINDITQIVSYYGISLCLFLNYLNSKHFIHRNITLSSISIDTRGNMKINDFSYTIKLKKADHTVSAIEPSYYSAPEILKGEQYSYSCDYWSVGVCLYYLCYNKFPFVKKATKDNAVPNDPMKLYKAIAKQKEVTFGDNANVTKDVKEFIMKLLIVEPKERLCCVDKVFELELFKNKNVNDYVYRKIRPPVVGGVIKNTATKSKYNVSNLEKNDKSYVDYLQGVKMENKEMYIGFQWIESF